MLEQSQIANSLKVVVTRADGTVKDTRFLKLFLGYRFEFTPNTLCLKLINQGRLQPNTWKIPFLFGSWTATKETIK